MRHTDRVAIITGGGNGIGQSTCEYMAQLGCTVIVADIKEDDAQKVTVATELHKKSVTQSAAIKGMTPQAFLQEFFIDPTPLGCMAQPLDVAQAVSFLASDEASFITGSTLNVAGGREMH